jgi:hypothetical protein
MTPSSRAEQFAPLPLPRTCPWCHGQLSLKAGSALEELIPGGIVARPNGDLPLELRSVAAWVCDTPHCRYRKPVGPLSPQSPGVD